MTDFLLVKRNIEMNDLQRITFIIERDGMPSALKFANQAIRQYRRAVLSAKAKYGKNHTYRKRYIDSYLFHKEFYYGNEAER